MAVSSSLSVDRSLEIELLDDVTGSETEVVSNDGGEVLIRSSVLDGTVRIDMDGEGFGKTDSIRDLDEDSGGKAIGDKRLGNVSTVVSSRSVDL